MISSFEVFFILRTRRLHHCQNTASSNYRFAMALLIFHALVLAFLSFSQFAYAESWNTWGSSIKVVPKVSRDWIQKFPSKPSIIVQPGTSINAAIAKCDSIVGYKKRCTVLIIGNPLEEKVVISRSFTRIIGRKDATLSLSAGIFFSVRGNWVTEVILQHLNLDGGGRDGIFGIDVEGMGLRSIAIMDNEIHNFGGVDHSYAIDIRGNNGYAIKNILIARNHIYNMKTGSGKIIRLSGNVYHWEIINNKIHDVNNIAINIEGGTGTLKPLPSPKKRMFPQWKDTARYGIIKGNIIERMSTTNNMAYVDREIWAAAIYINGGRKVVVMNNKINQTLWGIEVGAENCVVSRDIFVTNNQADKNQYGDLIAGGYASSGYFEAPFNCDPRSSSEGDDGHGYVTKITVKNNLFLSTSPSVSKVHVNLRLTFAVIIQDGISVNAFEGTSADRSTYRSYE